MTKLYNLLLFAEQVRKTREAQEWAERQEAWIEELDLPRCRPISGPT